MKLTPSLTAIAVIASVLLAACGGPAKSELDTKKDELAKKQKELANLKAEIKVTPGGHTATCNADGEFVLDLPPGKYEVTISAEGFRTQTRKLTVRKEGVTVLNADLQAGKN